MIKNVEKRDGRIVEFDKNKIINAIDKAMGECSDKSDSELSKRIANYIHNLDYDTMPIEEIQNIVENKLMASNRKDVAKKYIIYRNERNRARQRNSSLIKVIKEKISASNVQNQNANVDEQSFGGRKGEADAELMKKLALDDYMSEMSRNNHLNNEIYIHDLDSYVVGMHNCLSVPFDKLLANGFNTRQTDVRPAQSVNTAFQLVAVLFQLQSLQQFGGVSATHLDWTMVPYVRKSFCKHFKDGLDYIEDDVEYWNENTMKDLPINSDVYKFQKRAYEYALDMTIREVYQAVEGLYHNLNTLQSRSGNQLKTRWLAA